MLNCVFISTRMRSKRSPAWVLSCLARGSFTFISSDRRSLAIKLSMYSCRHVSTLSSLKVVIPSKKIWIVSNKTFEIFPQICFVPTGNEEALPSGVNLCCFWAVWWRVDAGRVLSSPERQGSSEHVGAQLQIQRTSPTKLNQPPCQYQTDDLGSSSEMKWNSEWLRSDAAFSRKVQDVLLFLFFCVYNLTSSSNFVLFEPLLYQSVQLTGEMGAMIVCFFYNFCTFQNHSGFSYRLLSSASLLPVSSFTYNSATFAF